MLWWYITLWAPLTVSSEFCLLTRALVLLLCPLWTAVNPRLSVQLCRRPTRWVTLYVPVLLFLFISLVWANLDSNVSRTEDITLFLLMLQYVCFLWRINMARGLTNNKIISTVEFITTVCKLLLTFHHYLAALMLCRGTFFAHFVSFSPVKPWCFISMTESDIRWERHHTKCHSSVEKAG